VVLTGNELTAASSTVAALAIIGGYLGVRSANRNALAIAREERSARRHDELLALKRITYAKVLAALNRLAMASIGATSAATSPMEARQATFKERDDATMASWDVQADLEVLGPAVVRELAYEAHNAAYNCTHANAAAYDLSLTRLKIAMRDDVDGLGTPSMEGLGRVLGGRPDRSASSEA
jgi:hypothetical protein